MSPSFSFEPWKNLTAQAKTTSSTSSVRFDDEATLKLLLQGNNIRVWTFPGHLFVTFADECDERCLTSFSIRALNEPKCDFSQLDFKSGKNGQVVDIAEIASSGW